MTQFESSVKVMPYNNDRVYAKLSDLTNIEEVKEKLPQDKVKDLQFDADSVSFNVSQVGVLTLHIIEREPGKCIKFETVNSPLPFHLWIQLAPVSETECKMKLTAQAELNPFVKGMLQKPLEDGLEKMAVMLSMIPY